MYSVFTSIRCNHSRIFVAVNSAPLSLRMCSGTPRRMKRSLKRSKHVFARQATRHVDRQAFAAELVDDGQHPERSTVVRAGLDEVVAPDVIATRRPEPDARTVVEP